MKRHIATLVFLIGILFGFIWKYGNEPLSFPILIATVLMTIVWSGLIVLELLVLFNYWLLSEGGQERIILKYRDFETYRIIEPNAYKYDRKWGVFVLVSYMDHFCIFFPTLLDYLRALPLGLGYDMRRRRKKENEIMARYLMYVDHAVQRRLQEADDEMKQAQAELNRVNANLSSTLKNRTNQELKDGEPDA